MTQSQGKTAPEGQRGQANLPSALFVIALIVAGIWGWHHLSFDAQDIIIEELSAAGADQQDAATTIANIASRMREAVAQ